MDETPATPETGTNCRNSTLFLAGLEVRPTGSFVDRGDGFSGGERGIGGTFVSDLPGGTRGVNGSGGIIALSMA